MSDKLVVEFHGDTDHPLAVLVLHGGDNPATASLTLTAFLASLGSEIQRTQMSAGELASRFIVSQASLECARDEPNELGAVLIEPDVEYGYQLCRLYVAGGNVRAVVVLDRYSKTQEVREAVDLWSVVRIPCEFLSGVESVA